MSIRDIADCIGIAGSISVVRDLFGLRRLEPSNFAPRLSLLSQHRLLLRPHVHLNFIQVGRELFTEETERRIDVALADLREIYANHQVGIGRVQHYSISMADADGAEVIADHDEGVQSMDDWSVPNNGIDIFLVVDAAGVHGFSPIGGSCDKNDKISGVVVEAVGLDGFNPLLGRALAHEIGHYLGLAHRDTTGNLMHTNEFDMGESLDGDQVAPMRGHCMLRHACPSSTI